MIRINLLPVRAARKKERLRMQLSVLALSIVGTLLLCGGLYAAMAIKIDNQKQELRAINDEINQLRRQIGEVTRYQKLKEELQVKLDLLAELKRGQSGPVRLLDELSEVLPQRLWITSYREAAGAITISGIGIDEATVATFMKNLEASPYYRNVELQVTEQISQDGLKLQRFNVSARVAAPAPAAAPAS